MTYGELSDELARLQGEIDIFEQRGEQLSSDNKRLQRLLSIVHEILVELKMVMDVDGCLRVESKQLVNDARQNSKEM